MSEIELFTLQYSKADLEAAPEEERVFYLMITQLSNDLQILWKQVILALGNPATSEIDGQAASTVAMLNLRLLCGRLSEGGQTLHHVFDKIRPKYEAAFDDETKQAVASLYSLFQDRDNLLKRVRDKVGFHADRKETLDAFRQLSDETALGDYLARTINNTLYWSAAVINDAVLRNLTGLDQAPALNSVMSTAQLASALLHNS